MAYNLAYIRQRVLEDKLDDTEFDAGIVDRFINDAQRSIFNNYELPFTEKTFAGLLPDGGFVFTFPDDYQSLQSLKVVDPTDDRIDITDNYVKFRDFNKRFPIPSENDEAQPSIWTLHGNRLYLSAPTDQEYTLEIYYIKKPALLDDDSDVPEVPAEFEELLVLGAFIRILERNEDFDLAAFYKNGDYTDELDKMTARLGPRQHGGTMVMSQPRRVGYRSRGRR